MFEADQLRKLLGSANVPMRLMILLAINCGYGNSDPENSQSPPDFKTGWVTFPSVPQDRHPAALSVAAGDDQGSRNSRLPNGRSQDSDHRGLVFITKRRPELVMGVALIAR